MGTITFHPWPVRRDDVDHPDELRLDLDPQPGTDFADAVRVAAEARVLLGDLGYTGFPKTSGGRGVHIYVRIEPRWTFTDVRHAAIAFGRELERRLPGQVTTNWWKEERGERIFVDYNQNARDRTIASAYSVRPKPGAPVSAPVTWDELPGVAPEDFTVATMPARFAEVGDLHARDRRHRPLAAAAARPLRARRGRRPRRHALPARLPEDAGRAQARPALARPRPPATDGVAATGACGSFRAPRLAAGADGGGTTGPDVAVGASSRSTITGAWSLGPLALARLPVDPRRPHPLGDRRRRPARGRSASRGPGGTSRRGSPSSVNTRSSGQWSRTTSCSPSACSSASAARSGGVTWVWPT